MSESPLFDPQSKQSAMIHRGEIPWGNGTLEYLEVTQTRDFYDFWGALMDLFCVSLKIPADTVEWKDGLKVRSSRPHQRLWVEAASYSATWEPTPPYHAIPSPYPGVCPPYHAITWCVPTTAVCPPSKLKTDASIISPSPATCCPPPGISPHET